ncbi:hypothetical protein PQ610_06580 [Tardisphaera miroshnichenkoae]
MKIAINWPPDESFVSSIMYEGLMFIESESPGGDLTDLKNKLLARSQLEEKNIAGNHKKSQEVEASIAGEEESAKASSGDEAEHSISLMRLPLIGNDLKLKGLKELAEKHGVSIKGVASLINLVDKLGVTDMGIYRGLVNDSYLMGSKSFLEEPKDPKFPLQIMKLDRYQGFSVLERSLFKKQITVYMDPAALVVFLSGLVSSYITNVGADHYFLLFGSSVLPEALRNPVMWMSIKAKFKDDLREDIWRVRNNEELIALSVLLSTAGIRSAKENKQDRLSLRVIRVVNEGKAFKIYNAIPLEILLKGGPYSDLDQVERLQRLSKGLMSSASAFLAGRGNMDEGRHAYLALKELALFMATGDQAHRYAMLREMYSAEKALSKSGSQGKYTSMIYWALANHQK